MDRKSFSFILLLSFLLLSEEVVQTHAIWCSTLSRTFSGVCIFNHSCKKACLSEGFSYGRCAWGLTSRRCKCYKECGGEGGGGGGSGGGGEGGGGGGDYPPGGGDYPPGQTLITAKAVDEEAATTFGLESEDQPDSSAKSPEEGSPNHHDDVCYNAPAPSSEPPEGASSEASELKLDNFKLPPPFK